MPSRAKWTAVPRSILPVKVGVNVARHYQLGGRGPHLPSVQRDHRPTSNSSPHGPPEPLCLCLWNSRNKTAYSKQLRAAHLPSQLQQKPSEREKAPGPRPLGEFPFTHVTPPPPPQAQKHQSNKFPQDSGSHSMKITCLTQLFQIRNSFASHCSRAVHTAAAL